MSRKSTSASPGLAAGVLLLALLAPPIAAAQTVVDGQTALGAFFRIEVPDGWQPSDGLVIWNHGFSLEPLAPLEHGDLGPLADVQLAAGFAVAASSYSQIGWALFQTDDDSRDLVAEFAAAFDVPDRIFIHGASLGGIVTAQAIEQGDLGNVVGAFPFCGALAGSRLWDGALDLRLSYDFICGDVAGAAIPGGADGLPFPLPDFDEIDLALAVNVCTGLLLPGGGSVDQQARLASILDLSGLPASFLLTDMGFATFALHDLVFDPGKLAGGLAMENSTVDYGDAAVNAGIERVAAQLGDRLNLGSHFTPTGEVEDIKIVSIHTDKDGLVIVENESDYATRVVSENLSVAIVVEDEPSHCGFNEAEVLAAWDALIAWVDGAAQPTAASIQADCQLLVDGGTASGPCRYDPVFEIPDLDGRVRPRGTIFGDGFESGDTASWE